MPDNLKNGALSSINQSPNINNLSSTVIVSPQNISNGKSVVVADADALLFLVLE